jgi:hypothetical protein
MPVRKPKTAARKVVAKAAKLLPPVTADQDDAAIRKHAQGVLARGEACEAGKPLPRGATHVIVGKRADGTPVLKRRRFSAT